MKPTKIIVENERGAEYELFHNLLLNYNGDFDKFFKEAIYYPAPGFEDGEHLAYLQWQAHDPGEDWVNVPDGNRGYYNTRQIWVKAIDVEWEKEPEKEFKPYFAQVSGNLQTEVYAENIYDAFKLVLEEYKERFGVPQEFDGYDISCRVWCSYSDQN